jgi:peptide/nickel transport system permease protein
MIKNPSLTTVIALVLLTGVALLVAVVPLLPGYDAYTQDLGGSLLYPFEVLEGKRSILGTDKLGRDVLSRIALAGQVSIVIGLSAVTISMFLGVMLA